MMLKSFCHERLMMILIRKFPSQNNWKSANDLYSLSPLRQFYFFNFLSSSKQQAIALLNDDDDDVSEMPSSGEQIAAHESIEGTNDDHQVSLLWTRLSRKYANRFSIVTRCQSIMQFHPSPHKCFAFYSIIDSVRWCSSNWRKLWTSDSIIQFCEKSLLQFLNIIGNNECTQLSFIIFFGFCSSFFSKF